MDSSISKLGLLFSVLTNAPREFCDRLVTAADSKVNVLRRRSGIQPITSGELLQQCNLRLNEKLETFFTEGSVIELEEQLREQWSANPVLSTLGNARLGRFCYAICRALKPEFVLETGVAYGVTTSFVLQALAVNNKGHLWSIDLPPLGQSADDMTGGLIPRSIRSRWHLLRGSTRRVLPKILSQLPDLDMFLHDSLHTFRNMTFEYKTVWPKLRAGGVLISDDVVLNKAFEKFVARPGVAFSAIAHSAADEVSSLGVALKGQAAGVSTWGAAASES